MSRGFSKAIITGNLTRDPELRTTPNGATVCSFSVAVNRTYRDSSGAQQEAVSFIDCAAWSKAAEIIHQFAHKGTGILVSGRLDQHSWEDKATGQRRSRVEIVVEDFNFLGSAASQDGGSASSYGGNNYNSNNYSGSNFGGESAFTSMGASYGSAGAADAASASYGSTGASDASGASYSATDTAGASSAGASYDAPSSSDSGKADSDSSKADSDAASSEEVVPKDVPKGKVDLDDIPF